MKKIVLLFLILVLRLECFSQATASANISATIINIDTLYSVLKLRAVRSKADTIHIIDSILLFMQSKEMALPKRTVEIGTSTSTVVEILGQPLDKISFPNNRKQKWIYKDSFVYFNNGVVDIIQKHR